MLQDLAMRVLTEHLLLFLAMIKLFLVFCINGGVLLFKERQNKNTRISGTVG